MNGELKRVEVVSPHAYMKRFKYCKECGTVFEETKKQCPQCSSESSFTIMQRVEEYDEKAERRRERKKKAKRKKEQI